jgi:uncharacterized membrane protein YqjE
MHGAGTAADEPSVSSALERLGAAGQGVVAKRIELALLEGQELLSQALGKAALVGPGMVLAVVAWIAAVAALVLVVAPAAPLAIHLAIFASVNAGGALVLLAFGVRRGRSATQGGGSRGRHAVRHTA